MSMKRILSGIRISGLPGIGPLTLIPGIDPGAGLPGITGILTGHGLIPGAVIPGIGMTLGIGEGLIPGIGLLIIRSILTGAVLPHPVIIQGEAEALRQLSAEAVLHLTAGLRLQRAEHRPAPLRHPLQFEGAVRGPLRLEAMIPARLLQREGRLLHLITMGGRCTDAPPVLLPRV